MPREKKDGKYLNTYISREVVELLDNYSKQTGVSKAFVIENAIKDYISTTPSQITTNRYGLSKKTNIDEVLLKWIEVNGKE